MLLRCRRRSLRLSIWYVVVLLTVFLFADFFAGAGAPILHALLSARGLSVEAVLHELRLGKATRRDPNVTLAEFASGPAPSRSRSPPF